MTGLDVVRLISAYLAGLTGGALLAVLMWNFVLAHGDDIAAFAAMMMEARP